MGRNRFRIGDRVKLGPGHPHAGQFGTLLDIPKYGFRAGEYGCWVLIRLESGMEVEATLNELRAKGKWGALDTALEHLLQ
jgi:hypothetical protein